MKKNLILNSLACTLVGLTYSFAGVTLFDQDKKFTVQEIVESLDKYSNPDSQVEPVTKKAVITSILPSDAMELNLNNNKTIKLYELTYDEMIGETVKSQIPLEVDIAFHFQSPILEKLNVSFPAPKLLEPVENVFDGFTAKVDIGIGEPVEAKFSKPSKFVDFNGTTYKGINKTKEISKISFKEKGQDPYYSFKITGAEPTGDHTLKKVYFDAKVSLWCIQDGIYYRAGTVMSAYFYTINNLLEKVEPLDLTKYHVEKLASNPLLSVINDKTASSETVKTYEMQQGQFVSHDGFVYNHDGKLYTDAYGNAVKLNILEGATPDVEISSTLADDVITYPCDIKVSGALGNAVLSIEGSDDNGTFESQKFNITNAFQRSGVAERLMRGPVELSRINETSGERESIFAIFNTIPNNGIVDADPNFHNSSFLNPSINPKTTIAKSGKFIDSVFATVEDPLDSKTEE